MDETVGLLDEVAGLLFQKKGAGGALVQEPLTVL